jgi:hypothetical protein
MISSLVFMMMAINTGTSTGIYDDDGHNTSQE